MKEKPMDCFMLYVMLYLVVPGFVMEKGRSRPAGLNYWSLAAGH